MKALITGASGLLGSEVARLICADRSNEYWTLGRRALNRKQHIQGSFTDPHLEKILPANLELIVHLGAHVPAREAEADLDTSMRTNAEATLRLLEYASRSGVKRFVYASSSAVYGTVATSGAVSESIDPRPDNFYALSKFSGELFLEPYRFVHGIETIALRFSYIYGAGMRPSTVISKFAARAFDGLPLQIVNQGRDYFDLVHVSDAARAVVIAASRGSGIVNIGSGRPTSVLELAQAVIRVTKSTSTIEYAPSESRYQSKFLSIARAREQLDWMPSTALSEGLASTLLGAELPHSPSG